MPASFRTSPSFFPPATKLIGSPTKSKSTGFAQNVLHYFFEDISTTAGWFWSKQVN
jgi:hypothetical protein